MAVLIPIENRTQCPHCKTKLTKGYGYATDYICYATSNTRIIAGYVEWDSEIPKEPPEWCPFRKMLCDAINKIITTTREVFDR